jgi:hypothetical protein
VLHVPSMPRSQPAGVLRSGAGHVRLPSLAA